MIALLLALQLSTSNCILVGRDMIHCDTMDMTPQPAPQTNNDSGTVLGTALGQLIAGTGDQHVRMRLGRLLAAGDCSGAYQYALTKGRFDLASQVREICGSGVAPVQRATQVAIAPTYRAPVASEGPRRVRAKTASGYCLDVPPGYVGTGAENSPAITGAMPRCDQLGPKDDSPFHRYRR